MVRPCKIKLVAGDPTGGMEKVPYFGKTLLRWTVGGSTFMALPEKGARLMEFKCVEFVEDLLYGDFTKKPK